MGLAAEVEEVDLEMGWSRKWLPRRWNFSTESVAKHSKVEGVGVRLWMGKDARVLLTASAVAWAESTTTAWELRARTSASMAEWMSG